MTIRNLEVKDIIHSNEITRWRRPVDDDEISRRRDWELAQLPSLFIRISPDSERMTRETLREAIAHQEYIDLDVADMVIQSAIDDGIISEEDSELLRLSDGVDNQSEDFYHVE